MLFTLFDTLYTERLFIYCGFHQVCGRIWFRARKTVIRKFSWVFPDFWRNYKMCKILLKIYYWWEQYRNNFFITCNIWKNWKFYNSVIFDWIKKVVHVRWGSKTSMILWKTSIKCVWWFEVWCARIKSLIKHLIASKRLITNERLALSIKRLYIYFK